LIWCNKCELMKRVVIHKVTQK